MKIMLWHVHGGWSDAFVRGRHEYLLPWAAEGGPWWLGRGGRDWPDTVRNMPAETLREAEVDCVVLQRPEEIDLSERLLGRRPGRDVPAVYVEHNTPRGDLPHVVHPLADQSAITLVHVTHFNRLFWDSGRAPVRVIEHGVADPGPLYTGELGHLAAVINEPVRRGWITGSDLLARFTDAGPVDLFGMAGQSLADELGVSSGLTHIGDLPTGHLHREMARRRVYVHPLRWTSLGLSLIEAMHVGMPVVALAVTEAPRAVPPEAGAISTDVGELVAQARLLIQDPDEARRRGRVAREVALERYGLPAFLAGWDEVLAERARLRRA